MNRFFFRRSGAGLRVLMTAGIVAAAAGFAPLNVSAQEQLKTGEYACYGSGGRILAGLGFKVLSGGRYTDLDNKEKGSFSVQGDKVLFKGGHMGDMEGRNLRKNSFVLGKMATCEPY